MIKLKGDEGGNDALPLLDANVVVRSLTEKRNESLVGEIKYLQKTSKFSFSSH